MGKPGSWESQLQHALDAITELGCHKAATFPGIVVFDHVGRAIYANPMAEAVLGVLYDDIVGQTSEGWPGQMLTLEGTPLRGDEMPQAKVMVTGEPVFNKEYVYQRSSGERVVVSANASAIREEGGGLVALVLALRDITDRKRLEDELRFKSALTDSVIDSIFVYDPAGPMVYLGEAAYSSRGFTEAELMNMTIEDITAPEARHLVKVQTASVLRSGVAVYESIHLRKNGSVFPAEIHASLVDFEGRRLVSMVAQDIGGRKKAGKALARSHSLLEAAFESTADGLLVVDNEGRWTRFNQRFLELWRVPADLVAARDDERALAFALEQLSDPKGFIAKVRELYSRPEVESFDVLEFKDGRIFERLSRPQHIGDEVIGRVWSFRDATKQRTAQKVLVEAEEKYRTLVELSPDAIGIYSEGKVVFANHAALALAGSLDAEKVVGRSILDLVHPDSRGRAESRIREVIGKGKAVPKEELKLVRLDGTIVDVEITTGPLTYRGKPAAQVVIHDITDAKRARELSDALGAIDNVINSTRDIDDILNRVLIEASDALGADTAGVMLVEGGDWVSTHVHNLPQDRVGLRFHDEEAGVGNLAVRTGEPVAVNDATTDARIGRQAWEKYGIRSLLVIPLIIKSEAVGAAYFNYHRAPITFSPAHLDFGRRLATSVGLAMDNARLFAAERRLADEQRQAKEMSDAYGDTVTDLTSTRDFDEIMDRMIKRSRSAIGLDSGGVAIREGDDWVVRYVDGALPRDMIGTRFSEDEIKDLAESAERGETVVVTDVGTDPRIPADLADRLRLKSFVAIPVGLRGQVIATAILASHSVVDFTQSQIDCARKLSAAVTLALENAHLFEAERAATQEQRAARNLSDALNRINGTMVSTLEVESILQEAATEATAAMKVDGATVTLRDGDRWVIKHVCDGQSTELLNRQFPAPDLLGEMSAGPPFSSLTAQDLLGDSLVLLTPLVARDHLIGALTFHYREETEGFSAQQIDFATKLASSMGLALENARMFASERNIANTLQESLLTMPGHVEGIEFGCLYNTATAVEARVGGDFYDLFEIDSGKVGVVIGDVSGKGVTAATLTSVVKDSIRAGAYEGGSPSAVLAMVNRVVGRTALQSVFATVFFGILDTATGSLVYCNGGHPPPLIRRTGGRISALGANSPLVGAFSDMKYVEGKATLLNGEVLVLYTDGVVEARSGKGLFGEKALRQEVRSIDAVPSHYPRLIMDKVLDYSGGVLADDAAVLAVGRPEREDKPPIS